MAASSEYNTTDEGSVHWREILEQATQQEATSPFDARAAARCHDDDIGFRGRCVSTAGSQSDLLLPFFPRSHVRFARNGSSMLRRWTRIPAQMRKQSKVKLRTAAVGYAPRRNLETTRPIANPELEIYFGQRSNRLRVPAGREMLLIQVRRVAGFGRLPQSFLGSKVVFSSASQSAAYRRSVPAIAARRQGAAETFGELGMADLLY